MNQQNHTEVKDPLRIILIEDHGLYRESVRKVLTARNGYECVGAFSNMEAALAAMDKGLEAEMLLVDLRLPGMDGITGIPLLRERLPAARIIVLTAFTDPEKVFSALEAGGHGYLVKSDSIARLLQTLNDVVDGGTPLDPQIAGMVLNRFQKLQPIAGEEDLLSPREHEILKRIAQGKTRQFVADELDISVNTLSTYLKRIFHKLHVRCLPAAISEAIRRGWIDFSE